MICKNTSLWLNEHDTSSIYKFKRTHWQFENWSNILSFPYKYQKGKGMPLWAWEGIKSLSQRQLNTQQSYISYHCYGTSLCSCPGLQQRSRLSLRYVEQSLTFLVFGIIWRIIHHKKKKKTYNLHLTTMRMSITQFSMRKFNPKMAGYWHLYVYQNNQKCSSKQQEKA